MRLKTGRATHAMVSTNDELYVLGGYTVKKNKEINLYDCEVINVEKKKVTSIPSMKTARTNPVACIFDGQIYAIGGCDENHRKLADLETFSFVTRKWSSCSQTNVPRYGHSACVMDGKLFVVGGQSTESVEYYCPRKRGALSKILPSKQSKWVFLQYLAVKSWGSVVIPI